MDRHYDFQQIKLALKASCKFDDDKTIVINDDSINALKHIPDESVSLLLTDPPYHSTKKENIINDKSFETDDEFILWMERYAIEWKRVLRPNGTGFMFCSSTMEAKLEIMLSKYFNVLSHIVWTKPNEPGFDGWKGKMKKEALRQWYPQSERIIFFEPAMEGNIRRSYFGSFLKEKRTECGISGHELTERIGAYGTVNHGGAVSNWESGRNIPSKEQYMKICTVLHSINNAIVMPEYENIIRPFEVNANVAYTDVWNFPSVRPYKGKHPAEKPLDMLEHCINSTTYEGDIVLDCFAGSGSTLMAALRTNRLCIGIEIDPQWCSSIEERIKAFNSLPSESQSSKHIMKACQGRKLMPTLFDLAAS